VAVARIELGGTPRQWALLAVLAVAAVVVAVVRLGGGGGVLGGGGGGRAVEFHQHEIPRLVALAAPAGAADRPARNPFAYGPPPTPTPNLTPRPTLPPRPRPTPRPTPTPRTIEVDGRRLPPPPRFDRRLIGYFGPARRLVAVFRKGDEVEVAVAGDVLDGTFVVRDVDVAGVTIGYVGYPEEVTTRVPLAQK